MEDKIMKKSLIFGLIAVIGLIGCTRNQEIDIPEANLSIFARTESPAETKTVVESGVHVYWEPGDEIAVFMGEKSAKFTTDITAASGTATFKGTFGDKSWPEEPDIWAVYPFSEEVTFDGETITTTLPSEQIAREGSFGKDMNLSIAHSNSSSLQFYNVGGGIRFSLSQSGIQRITFEGNNNETLAGTATLAFDGGIPTVRQTSNGETILTLTVPDGGSFEPGKWYFIAALPCDLDEGFVLKLYKGGLSAVRQVSRAVSIRRGIYGSLANVDEGLEFAEGREHLFSSVIILDSDNIDSCVEDDTKGTCVMSFYDSVPEIHRGSVLCLDPEKGGHGVFLVTSATTNGKTVEMKGRKGDLSYVFHNTSFTLSTGSASAHSTVKSNPPTQLRYANQWELWRGEYSGDFTLFKNDDASLAAYFELNSGIDAEFTFSFNGVVKSIFDGVEFFKSKNYTTSVKLFGSLDFHTNIEGKVHKDELIDLAPNEEDKTSLLKHNFLPAKNLVFFVTGVPVIIHFGCDLYEEVRATVKGDLTFSTSLDLLFNGECGFSLNGGDSQPFQAFNNYQLSVEKQNPTLSGWGEISGTYYVFPRFYAWVDYTTGPALEIRPYTKSTLSGAIREDLVELSTADYLSSTFKVSIGAEWAIGLSTPLENYYYEASRTMKDMGTIKEVDVVTSPVALELTSASPSQVQKGVETSLKLSAMAEYFGEKALSIFPTIVKIEVPAANIATYKCSCTGIVDYSWTPQSDEEILYAKIFDLSGKVIDQVQFGSGTPNIKFEAIDLGLPSGLKWASCNLGASAPEDCGDYYAWGETEPKDSYSWENYKWCKEDRNKLTKYCNNSEYGYKGFTDNKSVLDPEDDAAHVNLGGKWRMPTDAEWEELINNCTWTKSTQFGSKLVTGPNGNSIILPSAGERVSTNFYNVDEFGYYWSSSLQSRHPLYVRYVYFTAGYVYMGDHYRYVGYTIRPVYEE